MDWLCDTSGAKKKEKNGSNANHDQSHIHNLFPSLEEEKVPQQQKVQRSSFPMGSRFSSSSNHTDETSGERGDPFDLLLNQSESNISSDLSSYQQK